MWGECVCGGYIHIYIYAPIPDVIMTTGSIDVKL